MPSSNMRSDRYSKLSEQCFFYKSKIFRRSLTKILIFLRHFVAKTLFRKLGKTGLISYSNSAYKTTLSQLSNVPKKSKKPLKSRGSGAHSHGKIAKLTLT